MLADDDERTTESPCTNTVIPAGVMVAWLPAKLEIETGDEAVEHPVELLTLTT